MSDHAFTDYAVAVRHSLHQDAYSLCQNWHDAEDLVQTVLFNIYRKWPQLREQDKLRAYTHIVLIRAHLSQRRRPRWQHEFPTDRLPEQGYSDPSPRRTEDLATWQILLQALGVRQREILFLRFWAGLSVEQTAAKLGCTCGNVTSQTSRALRHLRSTTW